MRKFSAFVVIFTAVIGFTLFGVSLVKAGTRRLRTSPAVSAAPARRAAPEAIGAYGVPRLPSIKASYRISIPFGFGTPLPILDQGQSVLTNGHGGCTAGEQVTVAVTVTQAATGAEATGGTQESCTGELQRWNAQVTLQSGGPFVAGEAQACGYAVTRDGDEVTDTYPWCRDITLGWPLNLPFLQGA
jgi:hypothetical protein